MSIYVKNVSKYYQKKIVLDNISFELKKGEIVGFLGPNGAGKSTLMKIICAYLKQNSGTVKVSGKDTLKESKIIKKKIGFPVKLADLCTKIPNFKTKYLKFSPKIAGIL